jgi:hypothetical protein
LLRALVSMYVIVPAAALGLALAFDLPPGLRTGLLAVAIAPIPPILPGKQLKFGGDRAYVFGLLVAVSLSSIVVIPLMVLLFDLLFERDTLFGPAAVLQVVGMSVLLPLAAGLATRQWLPNLADRIALWVSRIGNIALFASVVPILVAAWPTIEPLWGQTCCWRASRSWWWRLLPGICSAGATPACARHWRLLRRCAIRALHWRWWRAMLSMSLAVSRRSCCTCWWPPS